MKANDRNSAGGASKGAVASWFSNRQFPFVALAAIAAALVLNGCATHSSRAEADPSKYNFQTDYPAVGASE